MDRLPDAAVVAHRGPVRLHDLTARPGTHVLLARIARDVPRAALRPGVHVHRLHDRPGTTVVAVRPDGYLAYRGTDPAPRAAGWATSARSIGRGP